jgi:hypothetical protein
MTRTRVRKLRAELRAAIESHEVTHIGDEYQVRAILVPIEKHNHWDDKQRRRALRKAAALFRDAIRAELRLLQ